MRLPAIVHKALSSLLSGSPGYGGWGWPSMVRESFAGAWQRGVTVDRSSVLAYHAVYSCATLIASDIAKLRVKLVQQGDDGIWQETASAAFSPVLRRPNHYQNRIQFWESWILSKLLNGNAYVLKRRDSRNVVTGLYVLDPCRTWPLVTDSGDVYYQVKPDNLSLVAEPVTIPAREIIHDRWNTLFHPLCGLSPIWANGLAATQGLRIQTNSARFFGNDSRPGGILTAPGRIDVETATRLKTQWETNYSGENLGRVAVLGDGLKYEGIAVSAEQAQLIEQLRWTAEVVCSTFHVPQYKIGVGTMPTYNNIQALNVEYYSQCLQRLIEDAELCLDEGLEMTPASGYGTEFDVDGLLRMDSVTQATVLKEHVGAGVMAPNEARARLDLRPTAGGEGPYLQQQNYSLAALAKRDAQADPFASKAPAAPPADPAPPPAPRSLDAARAVALFAGLRGERKAA